MTAARPSASVAAILPLGKFSRSLEDKPAELTLYHRRSFLDWAVDEALEAGAGRLVLIASRDYGHGPGMLASLQQRFSPGSKGTRPDIQLLRPDQGPDAEWDGLVRQAAAECTGPHALLIDPALLLTQGGRVVTFTASRLCHAQRPGTRGACSVFATARLPWVEALHMPVIDGSNDRLQLRFDRAGTEETLDVFAGRALLSLPLRQPDAATSPWPLPYRFPGETVVQGFAGSASLAVESGCDLLSPDALLAESGPGARLKRSG